MNKDTLALTLIRITAAGNMLIHGIARIINDGVTPFDGFLSGLGFPLYSAWVITLFEIAASILIIVGKWIQWTVATPVLLGCAAYEAGNILGAVSGINLLLPGDGQLYTIIITMIAAFVLWQGGSKLISVLMTVLVGLMGVAFLFLAFQAEFSAIELIESTVVPTIPTGSEWIILALVGTTIVPYNIFIGSAISKGSTVPLMRLGLSISVIIGGLITSWILLAGSVAGSFTTFPELAGSHTTRLGVVGGWALGIGLFSAGLSSSITAPYAASIIVSTVLDSQKKKLSRLTWIMVLLTGFVFGFSGVKPIPVILAVQALNGLVLPLLSYFLILQISNKRIVPASYRHSVWYDLILLIVFGTTVLIGLNNVDKAISTGFNTPEHFDWVMGLSGGLLLVVGRQVWKLKKPESNS